MSYKPRTPVHYAEIFEMVVDNMDVVYHGKRSTTSHLKHFTNVTTMCGQWPKNHEWNGTQDQHHRDRARGLPLCDSCIGAAFRQGYLRKRDE